MSFSNWFSTNHIKNRARSSFKEMTLLSEWFIGTKGRNLKESTVWSLKRYLSTEKLPFRAEKPTFQLNRYLFSVHTFS
jgi:hypothetical protein